MGIVVRALAAAALLFAGGCTTMVRDAGTGDAAAWDARRAALAPLDRWQLDGRVAIAAGDDGYSGTLAWVQDGAALDFRFKGPLGFGGLRIWGDADALTVQTHKGETFSVTDPERDFEARLGWSLPIRSMRYWMAGIPDPASPFEARYDGQGRPLALEQQGWRVAYDEFQQVGGPLGASQQLPRKLTIERDAVRIKVVAERWTFRDGAGAAAEDDDTGMDL